MSTVKPRHAIGYHFFNEQGTHDDVLASVRSTYDGPLSLGVDNMVWNISKDAIVERMIVSPDQAWPENGPNRPPPKRGTVTDPISSFIKAGRWQPAEEAQSPINFGGFLFYVTASFLLRAVRCKVTTDVFT